jgi:hypothetical protein
MAAPEVVLTWGPIEAVALQKALRLTNEGFAAHLGSAPRTIAKWHAKPHMHLTLEMQEALDVLLQRASAEAQARFFLLRGGDGTSLGEDASFRRWARRLESATSLHTALAWLDGSADGEEGSSFERVVSYAAVRGSRLRAVAKETSGAGVVQRLQDFYREGLGDNGFVQISLNGQSVPTTILSHPAWLHINDGMDEGLDAFGFDPLMDSPAPALTPELRIAAEQRLADVLVDGTHFVDAELYRLTDVRAESSRLTARFATGSFSAYALTWDLLEAEATRAASNSGHQRMPLREQLLPTVASVTSPATRLCMGGVLALTAFARSAAPSHPADYLLLVQERGDHVVNASRRLAVIPKCFHEPSGDPTEDAHIRTSLIRELEEELFGRDEVDSTIQGFAIADPLHPSRMTEPMRWLLDNDAVRLELTGFGFNLISGNFEFPALVEVHDERFWPLHGGAVVANWEAARLRRLSTMDEAGLASLIADPAWSNEGLFAFVAGLRRLAQIDPTRVRLPNIQIGVAR